MKLTCLQENLNKSLSSISRVVSSRVDLPILSNVLLSASSGKLRLTSTDLETSLNVWMGAQVEEEGEITVSAKTFFSFVSSLSPQKLTIWTEDKNLKIKGESTQASFVTISPEDFPKFPEVGEKPMISIESPKLANLVDKTAFATASDEGRPVLTGILLKLREGNITFVATDGFRLSETSSNLESREELSLVIPARGMLEVRKMLEAEQTEQVEFYQSTDQNQIIANLPNAQVASRLLEASYPEYEKIIPAEFKTTALLPKLPLSQTIKTAAIFAQADAQTVILDFNPGQNKLEVRAKSAQIGEGSATLNGEITGAGLKVALNARFLLDALAVLDGEEVEFKAKDNLSPCMLRSPEQENFLHIIMPIRLEE